MTTLPCCVSSVTRIGAARKTRLTRLATQALLSLSLPLSACSSKGGSGDESPTATPTPGASSGPGSGGPNSNSDALPAMEWTSDIRDAVVAPCTDAQVFARETCWDEVNFNETRLALRRPGEEFVVFEGSKPLSPAMAKLYRYKGPSYLQHSLWTGDSQSLLSEGIERLREKPIYALHRYWILPEEIIVSKMEDGRALKDELAVSVEFPLSFNFGYSLTSESGSARNWMAKGTATLCGKALALPLLQKDVEVACGIEIGAKSQVDLTHANGSSIRVDFVGSNSDLAQRWVHYIVFRAAYQGQP
jgi:hypothetical protein